MGELSGRSFSRGIWVYSDFLTLDEQDALSRAQLPLAPALFGGYGAAERKLAVFGSEELCGYAQEPPVTCLGIEPLSRKFADALTHRDFLGALMSLGVKRETMGDIVVAENCGYLICLDSIAGYLAENLTSVRHTAVKCAPAPLPAALAAPPEPTELVVASERLDALVAAVYRLSRSESRALIEGEKIFLNGRLERNADAAPEPGVIVSARGMGRFSYEGPVRETKKGRLRVTVRIYR